MAKFVAARPEWVKAERVSDLFSLSGDFSTKDFVHYIDDWQEFEPDLDNGYRLYDSPEIVRQLAGAHHVDLADSMFFFYEVYELEYDGDDAEWYSFDPAFRTQGVVVPSVKELEGFDVVSDGGWPVPGWSVVAGVADVVEANEHCLLPSLERARQSLNEGRFDKTEPGPFRIFAVYSVTWP